MWEKQVWCRTCVNSDYVISLPYVTPPRLIEDCYGHSDNGYFVTDYNCRTACWEILHNYTTNVFDDEYSNGGLVLGRLVAQIPFYQQTACLVQLRQSSLTRRAYQYYRTVGEQTQNTGGVAAAPPTALVGNVRNLANEYESVIGYFTATAVATSFDWIDRRDATGRPPSLFEALNGRPPSQPFNTGGYGSKDYPTATCVPSDGRTPNKPIGWQD